MVPAHNRFAVVNAMVLVAALIAMGPVAVKATGHRTAGHCRRHFSRHLPPLRPWRRSHPPPLRARCRTSTGLRARRRQPASPAPSVPRVGAWPPDLSTSTCSAKSGAFGQWSTPGRRRMGSAPPARLSSPPWASLLRCSNSLLAPSGFRSDSWSTPALWPTSSQDMRRA